MWMKVSLGLTLTWKALALLELLWLQSYLLHKSYLRSSDPDSSDFSLSNSPASITAVISQSHSRTCPSVPSLPSCLVVFQLFQLSSIQSQPVSRHWPATASLIHTSAMMSDGVGLLSCSSSSFFCFVLTVNRFYLHVLLWQQSILLHQYWLLVMHSQPAPTKTKKCIFLKSMAADSCFLALSLRPLTVW